MKTSIKFIFCLFAFSGFAQINNSSSALTNNTGRALQDISSSSNIQSHGLSVFFNPARDIDGSIYLLDNWDNNTKVITADNYMFELKNTNFNIDKQVFQSKISKDSIFTLSLDNISKIQVGAKTFKPLNEKNETKVYEVISESKTFSILKKYKLKFIQGSPNPMLNRKNDTYKTIENYFILRNKSDLQPFKLKKKSILSLFKDKSESVATYAKKNKLSFSKDNDINRIINYYNSL